jgi:hypothetical protein
MESGNYADACRKFEESQRLDPALGTVLNLADCYEKEGRLASAWSAFVDAQGMALGGGHVDAESVARERASQLAPRLSRLVIEVENAKATPGLEVRRDDAVVGIAQWGAPIPADAGVHIVRASAPGRSSWETQVTLGVDPATVTVRVPVLPPALPPEGQEAAGAGSGGLQGPERTTGRASPDLGSSGSSWSGRKTAALALAGVGLVAGTAAVVEWIRFNDKKSDAEGACPGNYCYSPQYELALAYRDDERTARNLAIVAGAVATASLAGAAILWFSSPKPDETSKVRIFPRAGSHDVAVEVRAAW